jgi:hypothetical protein
VKTVTHNERSRDKLLHIEAPGCIINIHVGLTDNTGRSVTAISINADGDRYSGDPAWWIDGEKGNAGVGVRVVQMD